MEPFDDHIRRVAKYVARIGKKGRVREMDCPTGAAELMEGVPVRVASGGRADIILKEDTAGELGNPSVASCAFHLWTPNLSLVRAGRITQVGPDIQEALGQSLPFAQVLIIGGAGLRDQHHLVLEQHHVISNQIEGYMVRLAPQRQRMWTRVSKEAAAKGFSFETLGRALMAVYKSRFPIIEAAEVVFLTSSKEDVKGLERIATEVRRTKDEALSSRFVRRSDGSYECTSQYVDCRECPDEVVCDEIRALTRLRRKRQPGAPSSQ